MFLRMVYITITMVGGFWMLFLVLYSIKTEKTTSGTLNELTSRDKFVSAYMTGIGMGVIWLVLRTAHAD
jgi:hypothetical protein